MQETKNSSAEAEYKEYSVPNPLRPYFVCLWSQIISKIEKPFVQVVLPDGCADIVWIDRNPPIVVGPATRPFTEFLPAGCRIIGARFRPGACSCFLRVPASDLQNQQLNLGELWRKNLQQLTEEVQAAETTAQSITILQTALLREMPHLLLIDHMVQAAIARLLEAPTISIRELSKSLGSCERQFLRRFSASVGYGPKILARVARLQQFRSWAVQTSKKPANLAALAYELGFSDQAHMTREIGALSGLSPAQLLAKAATLQTLSHDTGI